MNITQHNILEPAHLIVDDSLFNLFNESRHLFGISTLVHKPNRGVLIQQFLRLPLDLSQCAVRSVGMGGWDEQPTNTPDQPFTPPCFLRVLVDRCCGDILFEPLQLGPKILNALLDIFKLLQGSILLVINGHQRHLIPRNA